MTGRSRVPALSVTVVAVVLVLCAAVGAKVLLDRQGHSGGGVALREQPGEGILYPGFGSGAFISNTPWQEAGALHAPGAEDWWVTFGASRPCLLSGSQPATLVSVTPVTSDGPRPLDFTVMVRRVTEADMGRPGADLVFVKTQFGSVPDFAEPYAYPEAELGTFVDPSGVVLDRRCDDLTTKDGFRLPVHELQFSVRAGREGAVVDHLDVEYEVGGRRRVVATEYRVVLCGTEIEEKACEFRGE